MPGSTNNTNFLEATNQLIKAVNDLADKIAPSGETVQAAVTSVANRLAPNGSNINDTLKLATIRADGVPYLQNLEHLHHLIELAKINASLETIAREIAKLDDKPSLGVGTIGEGDPPYGHDDWPTYSTYKCKAANAIYDVTFHWIEQMQLDDVDALFGLGITTSASAIVALLASGPTGWAVGLMGVAITAVAAFLASNAMFDLQDIATILTNNKTEIICAVYNANTASEAKQGFLSNLSNLTPIETGLISLMLSTKIINMLFNDYPIPEDYTPTVDCQNCIESDCTNSATVLCLDPPQGMIIDGVLQIGSWALESRYILPHENVHLTSDRLVSMSIYADIDFNCTLQAFNCGGEQVGETIQTLPTDAQSAISINCAKFTCLRSSGSGSFILYVQITEV